MLLAKAAEKLLPQEVEDIGVLFEVGEIAVGLEHLCIQLVEHEQQLSGEEQLELLRLANAVNLSRLYWEPLMGSN